MTQYGNWWRFYTPDVSRRSGQTPCEPESIKSESDWQPTLVGLGDLL